MEMNRDLCHKCGEIGSLEDYRLIICGLKFHKLIRSGFGSEPKCGNESALFFTSRNPDPHNWWKDIETPNLKFEPPEECPYVLENILQKELKNEALTSK